MESAESFKIFRKFEESIKTLANFLKTFITQFSRIFSKFSSFINWQGFDDSPVASLCGRSAEKRIVNCFFGGFDSR